MADLGKAADKAMDSDKGEQASDAAIGKAGDEAEKKTGGKADKQVDSAEQAADKKIGQ